MADLKRTDFQQQLKGTAPFVDCNLFIFYGERFLCYEAANQLEAKILTTQQGTVHKVDGSTEDAGQTLSRLMSYSLLPGLQIYRVAESRIFQSKTVIEKIWKKAIRGYKNGRTEASTKALHDMAGLGGIRGKALKESAVFSSIAKTQWKKAFGFEKPAENLSWADNLVCSEVPTDSSPSDLIDAYITSFDKGLPAGNILILTAETVDKRQRFFTYCKKFGTTIDCMVASGSNKAAQQEQQNVVQEQLRQTLQQSGKTMTTDAAKIFIDRVGCHPIAVVNEAEKLALHAGEEKAIKASDVEQLIGQTREDALFELTEALSNKQAAKTLNMLKRIHDNGIHPLAIIATLRNFIRKLLQIRAVQAQHRIPWQHNMNSKQFQDSYLPSLKENEQWLEFTKGHPFALYKNFMRAAEYSPTSLSKQLSLILNSEFRLKSSFLPQQLILEELFIAILRCKKL